ncbi:AAA family ATPase [Roseomonas marmotae]|uniref:AAA family ATPase n=1 Tax=Roseomonas marmotae TaxID=2768161 RepID=A0ABS3KBE4_9PROT|nr:ParA family partition ATPase [Roseomonas marmotae]MBO1073968.1 AAA family ATPase [Roseomonas marmotae]QTI78760.1 AAA family ATPase [Roseomonas marmotae]
MAFVVAVAQRKGGAGKSTLAATLATTLAAEGRRVALLDTDPQKTLARWWSERASAGPRARPMSFEDPSGWRLTSTIERMGRAHDVVVLDTPPHADTDARIAIRAADVVLVPLQPSPADLWAMEGTLALAKEERRPAVLVLNRVPSNGRLREQIAKELQRRDLPLLEPGLGNRTAFASAFALGLGVVEGAPRSTAAEEARAVTAAVLALQG